jgi:hypothetical protein
MSDQSKPTNFPVFTAWAFVGPVLLFALGFVFLIAMPQVENGIYHGPALTPLAIALLGSCLVAVACSVVAFIRKERVAFVSLIPAIPALVLLVAVVGARLHLL